MRIKKIVLETINLTKLRHFYHQTLGLELLHQEEDYFELRLGNSRLGFRQASQKQDGVYHFAFNIPENQLEAAKQWLSDKGLKILEFENNPIVDFPNWNAHALYFLDSDANVLELIARHDLANASTQAFSSQSLLEISEIGFGLTQIAPFYDWLKAHFAIPVYSHISNMTRFCAAGDPQGLFILVPLERKWFPSNLTNAVLPTEVHIEGQSRQSLQYADLPYYIISQP